jgi:hypothetical protein
MAEDRGAYRSCDKADSEDREGLQRACQRIGCGEIQLRKYDRGHLAVEQKIVPFDRRAYRAGDNGAAQLGAMVEVGKRRNSNVGNRHWGSSPSARIRCTNDQLFASLPNSQKQLRPHEDSLHRYSLDAS